MMCCYCEKDKGDSIVSFSSGAHVNIERVNDETFGLFLWVRDKRGRWKKSWMDIVACPMCGRELTEVCDE